MVLRGDQEHSDDDDDTDDVHHTEVVRADQRMPNVLAVVDDQRDRKTRRMWADRADSRTFVRNADRTVEPTVDAAVTAT